MKRLFRRLLPLLLAFCCLATHAAAAPSAQAADATAKIDKDIDRILRGWQVVGGAVLVARRGEILYEHYYGMADIRTQRPVTADTYFRGASVTKFVTGVGVMRLVEQGKLSLDADISEALGFAVRNPRYKNTPVTLRQLMTHTSSFRDTGGYSALSSTLQGMFIKRPSVNFLPQEPGTKYTYSNFAAGTVGSIIEAATQRNVNDYMTEAVFAPLGIDAAYSASMVGKPENVASLYINRKTDVSFGKNIAIPYDNSVDPDRHYRTVAGSLWIRPKDLMKIASLLCEGGEFDGVRLLQPETVAQMMADQKGVGSVSAATPYGLFIKRVLDLVPGKMLYGHQGTSSGFVCSTYYDPETGYTFVMMNNGCDQRRSYEISILSRKLVAYTYPLFAQ